MASQRSRSVIRSPFCVVYRLSLHLKMAEVIFRQCDPRGRKRKRKSPDELAERALERARRYDIPTDNRRPGELVLLSAQYRYKDAESPLHRDKVPITASVALARYFTASEWRQISKSDRHDEAVELLKEAPLLPYWTNYVGILLAASSEYASQALSGRLNQGHFAQYAHRQDRDMS